MDDLAVPQHHRSGAHRARRHPVLVALATLGAVAVASAVLLWGLLSVDVLGVGDDLRQAGGVLSAPSAGPSTAVPSPAEPSVGASETGVVPSPPASPEPAPEPSPEATVDRALPVTVLNSTSTPGLAAAAAEALGAAGWQVGDVDNYGGDEIPTTVLYPDGAADPLAGAVAAMTAAAVASDLGVGEATASPEVDGLTVVLGADYDP